MVMGMGYGSIFLKDWNELQFSISQCDANFLSSIKTETLWHDVRLKMKKVPLKKMEKKIAKINGMC